MNTNSLAWRCVRLILAVNPKITVGQVAQLLNDGSLHEVYGL